MVPIRICRYSRQHTTSTTATSLFAFQFQTMKLMLFCMVFCFVLRLEVREDETAISTTMENEFFDRIPCGVGSFTAESTRLLKHQLSLQVTVPNNTVLKRPGLEL